jgi:transposase
VSLSKLLQARELTAICVPDERHEAMRDLCHARDAAQKCLNGKRHRSRGSCFDWDDIIHEENVGRAHMNWLML